MTKYYTLHKDNHITSIEIDACGYSQPVPIPILLTGTETKSGYSILPVSEEYIPTFGGYNKYQRAELDVVITIIQGGGVVETKSRDIVNSSSISESSVISKERGMTFLWTSSYSATTGDLVYYLNNDSTAPLVVDKVTVNSECSALFELFLVSGTASGTDVPACSVNRTIINVAEATSKGDAAVTGLTLNTRIDLARVGVHGRATMELQDVIVLGEDDAIAVRYAGATGVADIITTGYYRI